MKRYEMKIAKELLAMSEEIMVPHDSLGIPRNEMPQVDPEHLEKFYDYLDSKGISHELEYIPASLLHPSQNELDTDKADKIWDERSAHDHSILVSNDDYIIDGHHRWLAVKQNKPSEEMSCVRIDLDAKSCIQAIHDFEHSKKLDIDDNVVESTGKPVNYTVKSVMHFPDGINKGQLKVKAVNAEEAEKLAREKLTSIWNKTGKLQKIEILGVKKG